MKVPFFSRYPGRSRAFLLLLTDVGALFVSILLALSIYKCFGAKYDSFSVILKMWPIPIMVVAMNLVGRLYLGNLLYPGLPMNPVEEIRRLTLSIVASYVFFAAILTFTRTNLEYSRTSLVLSLTISLMLLPMFRVVLRQILLRIKAGRIPAIILGESKFVEKVIHKIQTDRNSILDIAGTVSDGTHGAYKNYTSDEVKAFGTKQKFYLIYCPSERYPLRDLRGILLNFHRVLVVEGENTYPVLRMHAANFYSYFAFESGNCLRRRGSVLQKRILEFVFSLIAITLALIPMVILAILVKLSSKGPVFYVAKRLGRKGRQIRVLKFRTMYPDAEERLKTILEENPAYKAEWEKNFKLEKDPRITPLGNILRKTSLDELPQLLNVLRGEMSLIGPRPIVEKEVAYYGDDYAFFSSVKPGITGLWQVSGRSDIDYEDRVALDVFYVNNWSIWMDLYIFFATFGAVLFRKGAK